MGVHVKRCAAGLLLCATILAGCRTDNAGAPARPTGDPGGQATVQPGDVEVQSRDPVIARVGSRQITAEQLQKPLMEAYGLNVLLNLVQLELARDTAQRQGITVSAEDVEQERKQTLSRMFKDSPPEDYPALMEQFLQQQRISRPEFEIVIETNAHLRKIAEPKLEGKISEENVKEAFLQTYGETVRVRHIQCANLQEIVEAQRRIAAGEAFDAVAREVSRNAQTKALGGGLPSFSRTTPGLPQAFKDAAFSLQPGQISDPVQAEGAYHLIKLEERVAPRAVKYEDHKEIVRADLYDRLLQAAVKELRQQLAQQALSQLRIEDPVLRAQFDARKNQRDAEINQREEFRKDLEKQRQRLATQPSTTQESTGQNE